MMSEQSVEQSLEQVVEQETAPTSEATVAAHTAAPGAKAKAGRKPGTRKQTEHVMIRMDATLFTLIDAHVTRMQARVDSAGIADVTMTRAHAIRDLLKLGAQVAEGAALYDVKQREAPLTTVDAPAPTGAPVPTPAPGVVEAQDPAPMPQGGEMLDEAPAVAASDTTPLTLDLDESPMADMAAPEDMPAPEYNQADLPGMVTDAPAVEPHAQASALQAEAAAMRARDEAFLRAAGVTLTPKAKRAALSAQEIERIVQCAEQYDKLSLAELATLMHERGIYTTHDGKPIERGHLSRILKKAKVR
jgi:hypothetical protein